MAKPKSPRIAIAAAVAALVVGLSSCGAPQTLQPYTPAEGVNVDSPRLGAPEGGTEVPLKVRNLLIVSAPDSGTGFLSGALLSPYPDQLVRVEGRTLTPSGEPSGVIPPVSPALDLPPDQMVILTDGPAIQLASPELTPGLIAELTLTFQASNPTTVRVPVVDATKADYATLTPAPAAPTPAAPTPADTSEVTPEPPAPTENPAPTEPA